MCYYLEGITSRTRVHCPRYTSVTHLLHLRFSVTSCPQIDHGQCCKDAQRGIQDVFIDMMDFHLVENIETKFCICYADGIHSEIGVV